MNSKLSKFLFLFIFAIATFAMSIYAAEGNKKDGKNLDKVQGNPSRAKLNINSISTIIGNDGISDIDPSGNSGLVFPKGSGKAAVFTSGLLWGALVPGDPQPRVGGTAYRTGLQPGRITNSGVPAVNLTAEDPAGANVRIYRVRRDIFPGGPAVNLAADAIDEATSASALRTQYEKDWTEWPAAIGAPYEDVNGNGTYEPATDIPGVKGANQTIWYVANDVSSAKTVFLYGAQPLGIEMQATFWAYSQTGALGSMFFRKYKIINKSDTQFNDMYVSMFSDVDLGNSSDDFAGCDTTLSLGYVYNANANDATYNPLPPPAVGFDFFQGPLLPGVAGEDKNKNGIDDAEDSGISDGKLIPGKINLPMTSFYYFARGDAAVVDPTQGDIAGSTQFYRFFQGRIGLSGEFFVDPNTGQTTTYALSGDPQARTGWVDGQLIPADDRRIGSASGPFTMMPGDVQEIVVAEIVAGAIPGMDRLSAIGLLKFYDAQAQSAYNNFFDLAVAPPRPDVAVTELENEIVLDWAANWTKIQETETFAEKGYVFQGYNVYQLPSASADKTQGKRIATYDINDGIGKIEDRAFDPETGVVAVKVQQFGNDTGIKRFLSIKNDELGGGTPLINGKRYYFAVTAYGYNPEAVPNNLENPLSILTVVPHSPDPGVTLGEASGSEIELTHTGTADGGPTVIIDNPVNLTGHDYQVFFSERQEIRNQNGDWVPASVIKRGSNPYSTDTLTSGTSVDISAVYGATGNDIELHCVLNVESPDGDWVDGVTLTFPPGVTVLSVPKFDALNTDAIGGGSISPIISGNTVILGDTTHPYSGNGPFEGGEEWIIYVSKFTPPLTVGWKVFDDGFGGGPIDAEGTTTTSEVSMLHRLAKYWNLKDVTTGEVKLTNQSVINGTDIFPRRDDIPTNIGNDAAPVVDGFQITVDAGYAAPIIPFSYSIASDSGSRIGTGNAPSATTTIFANYTLYGTATSYAAEGFGFGTEVIDKLQQDYEIRYTGVIKSDVINGRNVRIVESGGQMATIFSTSAGAGGLANNPLNPSPGTAAPFLIRLPFEVWNKDTHKQVNLMFRDRAQDLAADPFYAWNPENRSYLVIVNTDYDPTHVITTTDPQTAEATWIVVVYSTRLKRGDVVTISYANPIQIGVDTYQFKTTKSAFSAELAKADVNKINVFPNPYYGVNSEELNKYNRFVTFSHLPSKATVRIFNLAGVLVKTIEKTDASQFMRWDLANQSGLPVASGLYVAYIDMPDIGTTKILKIAVIQEQQILDRF